MFFNTQIEKSGGFRELQEFEVAAVSGGTGEIIVTGTRGNDGWISITPEDLALVGIFGFGDPNTFGSVTETAPGDGGGSSQTWAEWFAEKWEQIKEFLDEFGTSEPEQNESYLPISEDALGQILRDCLAAGGSYEVGSGSADGSVGYRVLSADGSYSYVHINCTVPNN
jgi:hypothetical protein